MTIHSGHPFATPDDERDVVRRLRGRLGGAVSLWTTGADDDRAGLTVSSLMVAGGEPGHLLALLDPESDLAERLSSGRAAVVHLLEGRHQQLAEAFAGQFPAPGGAFRMASWETTAWGPRLADAATWAGVRVVGEPRAVGWSLLVDAELEHVEVGSGASALEHRRGRYRVVD